MARPRANALESAAGTHVAQTIYNGYGGPVSQQ